MNHHILTLLRLAAVSIGIPCLGAQAAKISINGTVTDYNNGTPVSYAADVAAYTSSDSLADVQLTDDKGNSRSALIPAPTASK